MAEKKSLVEEALLQMKNLEQVVAENAKGILASTMKEEISELVKESLKMEEVEDETTEMDEMDEQSAEDILTIDVDSEEESDDESEEMDDMESEDDMDDMDVEDEMDMTLSMDDEDESPIDLTNASDEEILKVFKSMSDEDGIIVTKDDEEIHLSDEDDDVEYIIQMEGDEETDEIIDEEMGMDEMDSDEEISDEELTMMMDNIFQESEMSEEDSDEEVDEVVYEIEMDEEEDMDDMESEDEVEDMQESKFGIKPVMGHTKKSTLSSKAKKMETKEGDMMTKPVVGKGVKTGKPNFEFKEGKKMETKEEVIEPKGRAKGVGMNLSPKKFEFSEEEHTEEFGGNKKDFHREKGHKTGVKGGGKYGKGGHYKDYESKEETKEASRTYGMGSKEGRGLRKGITPNRNYDYTKGAANVNEEIVRLREKNEEYRKALNVFREKLNEVAVFNSNLAYATRLFTEHTTTKQEKINILRRFDDVETIKESKNLYTSIKNELSTQVQNVVTESVGRIEKSPASGSSQSLIESKTYENPQFLRMKDIMSKINK